jgi:hypothetical protein
MWYVGGEFELCYVVYGSNPSLKLKYQTLYFSYIIPDTMVELHFWWSTEIHSTCALAPCVLGSFPHRSVMPVCIFLVALIPNKFTLLGKDTKSDSKNYP